MFIKKTTKRTGGKTYLNHLLVESVATPKGPRHRVVCSLGPLAPAPQADWLALAHRVEAALSSQPSVVCAAGAETSVEEVEKREAHSSPHAAPADRQPAEVDFVTVETGHISVEQAREAGSVHVAHQMWTRLGLDEVLAKVKLSERARQLAESMAINRLVAPLSEDATPDWTRRAALADVLQTSFEVLADEAVCRSLDRLCSERQAIEGALAARERTLFNLDDRIYLYELTSTCFGGQFTVGLAVDREGFPKAHEALDGKGPGAVARMLAALEKRTGRHQEATVVVRGGMAFASNLQQIRDGGYHYIVASRQLRHPPCCARQPLHAARGEVLGQGEGSECLEGEVSGQTGHNLEFLPKDPGQRKSQMRVKRRVVGDELHILCTELRDGGYLLKTDRKDISDDEVWRTCRLLTRVEAAFRSMKGPFHEGSIVHHVEERTRTNVFLCVLAYHLLVAVEKTLRDGGLDTSWNAVREQLATHQVVTVNLPTSDGRVLSIRRATAPEDIHRDIYRRLGIPCDIINPVCSLRPAMGYPPPR